MWPVPTEAALKVTIDGKPATGAWNWSEDYRTVSFVPNLPADGEMKTTVTIGAGAESRSGVRLGVDVTWNFSWLRRLNKIFQPMQQASFSVTGLAASPDFRVGDSVGNQPVHLYVTFDASEVPADASDIRDVALFLLDVPEGCLAKARMKLGSLQADHVRFSSGAPVEALASAALRTSPFVSAPADVGPEIEIADVDGAFREDVISLRRMTGARVQFRIRFANNTNGDSVADSCPVPRPMLNVNFDAP